MSMFRSEQQIIPTNFKGTANFQVSNTLFVSKGFPYLHYEKLDTGKKHI